MKIECEKCGSVYEVGREYAGQRVECQCGWKMTVPLKIMEIESIDQNHNPDVSKTITKNTAENPYMEKFTTPALASWIYVIGSFIVVPCGIMTLFGIIAIFTGGKGINELIMFAGGALSGLLLMAVGETLKYLAEIAYNTRKK